MTCEYYYSRVARLTPPLVEKLGGESFAVKVKRRSEADWMIYFWLLPA